MSEFLYTVFYTAYVTAAVIFAAWGTHKHEEWTRERLEKEFEE